MRRLSFLLLLGFLGVGRACAGGIEPFLARLEEERVRLRARLGITDVDFDVIEREGKVKLVAKPRESPKSESPSRK